MSYYLNHVYTCCAFPSHYWIRVAHSPLTIGYMLHVPLSLLLDYMFSSVDKHILIHIHMIRNHFTPARMEISVHRQFQTPQE